MGPVEAWERPEGLLQGVSGAQGNKDNREGRPVRGAGELDGEHAGRDFGGRAHIGDIPWDLEFFSGKSKFVRNEVAGPGPVHWRIVLIANKLGEAKMLDTALLSSVARQMMGCDEVEIKGKTLPVRRTSRQGIRIVAFTNEGRQYTAIEQNPLKPSRWGELAQEGHQVVQFKDVQSNKFVAVVVDGEAKEYGGGKKREHPADRD